MLLKWAKKSIFLTVLLLVGITIGLYSGPAKEKEAVTPTAPTKVSKTIITFWKNYVDYVEAEMQQIIAQYESENPDIKIDYVTIPGGWDEYGTKLRLAFSAGREPDMFIMHDVDMASFVGNWLMAPAPQKIEELLEANAVSDKIVIHARGGIPDGPIVTVPLLSSFTQPFYNADLVAAAGLSGPAKTWDQFVDYAKKMTKRDSAGNLEVAGFALQTKGSGNDYQWQYTPWLLCTGQREEVTRDDPQKSLHNSENGYKALQFFVDLIHKHKVQDLETGTEVSFQFARGEAGIVNRSLWFGGWLTSNAPDLKVFSAPMPADKLSASLCGTIDIGATKGVNQDKCWDFIYWMVRNDEVMARFAALHTRIPPTRSAADRPECKENPLMAAHATQANLVPRLLGPGAYEASDILGKHVELAVYGKMGVKDALDKAAKEIDELLQEKKVISF